VGWVGSADKPLLSGDLQEAILNGSTDELLASDLLHLTTADRSKRLLWKTFLDAGRGVCPKALIEPSTPAEIDLCVRIARASAREWLRRLGSVYGASIAGRGRSMLPSARRHIRDEIYKSLDDDELTRSGATILQAVARNVQAETQVRARLSAGKKNDESNSDLIQSEAQLDNDASQKNKKKKKKKAKSAKKES
jgi:hypothetical protein